MPTRLLIVRNAESPLLPHLLEGSGEQEIVLIQNAVYSKEFDGMNPKLLENDARARNIKTGHALLDYEGLLDAVLSADKVVVV